MAYVASWKKDPNAVLDYQVDWAGPAPGPWLVEGDTISEATAESDDSDYLNPVTVDSVINDGEKVTFWLSGGTVGTVAHITVHITTSAGREDDRTAKITVVER